MSEKFLTTKEVKAYVTNTDEIKASPEYLTKGSKNVLIDRQKMFGSRPGFTYAFETGESTFGTKSGGVWKTSTGLNIPWRMNSNGDILVWFGVVDGQTINQWINVAATNLDASYPFRSTSWWYASKTLDYFLGVNHSDSIYYWSGGVAVVASTGSGALYVRGGSNGVTAGGSGYVVGDVLTVTGGGGTGGTVEVATVSGGAVTAIKVITVGSGYTAGSGLTTSGGTGTGCTVDFSSTASYITKEGTATWRASRFSTGTDLGIYDATQATTGELLLTDNSSDGNVSGSTSTTTLVSTLPTNIAAGDIIIAQFYENTNDPASGRINDNLYVFNNHLFLSSESDNYVYMSNDSEYFTFTYSTPRVEGEGALFQLDTVGAKFGTLSKELIMFAGDSRYIPTFKKITVSSTLTETIDIERYDAGSKQGPYSQETIMQIDENIIYLSNEPALRILDRKEDLGSRQLKTLSNPIKPDFDAETWTDAHGIWDGSRVILTAPTNSKMYLLEWVETADGGVRRFWQPPQTLPVVSPFHFDGYLYGYAYGNSKTLLLFNGAADYVYDYGASSAEKTAINAIAKRAYNTYGDEYSLKNFDEAQIEGYISVNTNDLQYTLSYDYGGETETLTESIDASNSSILFGYKADYPIGKQGFGTDPTSGSLASAVNLYKFRTIFEEPKEDFNEIQEVFETNAIDVIWKISSSGLNVQKSRRKNTFIKQ